jgi:hypothetical protein
MFLELLGNDIIKSLLLYFNFDFIDLFLFLTFRGFLNFAKFLLQTGPLVITNTTPIILLSLHLPI